MASKTVFEGIFRLTQPMHCATESEKVGLKNVMRTHAQSIFTTTGKDVVPFFPGTGIRGRLRRAASAIVLDSIVQKERFERLLFSGMCSGMEGSQPDSAAHTIEELDRYRKNVFMGVFGGGARVLESQYSVSNLVPVLMSTIDTGQVAEKWGDTTLGYFIPKVSSGKDLLGIYENIRIDDVMESRNFEKIMKYFGDKAFDIVNDYQKQVEGNQVARRADKTATADEKTNVKKNDASNMMAVETVNPGTPMYFHMDLSAHLDDAPIGLMAQALCNVVNDQSLGGLISRGYGRYTADLKMVRDGSESPLLAIENGRYVVCGEAAQYLDTMREKVADLTADSMTAFYLPREIAEANLKKTPKASKANIEGA